MKRTAVLLMCKSPVPGLCKTRMKPELNDEDCAALQDVLIHDTIDMLSTLPYPLFITYTPQETSNYYHFIHKLAECFPQVQGNLGDRISAGIYYVLQKGFSNVLVVGTDSPGLQPLHLDQAHQALMKSEVCVGPCEDGGYYLIGVRGLQQEFFEGIAWGTEKVFEQTLNIAKNLKYKIAILPLGKDLDCWADLVKFKTHLKNAIWEKRPIRLEKFLQDMQWKREKVYGI